jgi:hypothetical protein
LIVAGPKAVPESSIANDDDDDDEAAAAAAGKGGGGWRPPDDEAAAAAPLDAVKTYGVLMDCGGKSVMDMLGSAREKAKLGWADG